MVQEAATSARSADGTGRIAGGASVLVLASVGGTIAALTLWAARGWEDGLACYVATILAIGGFVLWRTRLRPTGASESAARAGPALPATHSEHGLHKLG